jgi:enoyl-CoA hydratase/carnithine racemase
MLFRLLTPRLTSSAVPQTAACSTRFMTAAFASDDEAEVLHEYRGALRAAVLNRPRALNALSVNMIDMLHDVYRAWDAAPAVAAILIKGAGGRAFCSGGDVKAVVQTGRAGDIPGALRFFKSEYRLNYLISHLAKPYIALIDGITMGGGAGVSMHGPFRVATERTLFAMPECAIGLLPDVGASHFLPRLHPGLGLYLGLTGARLTVSRPLPAQVGTNQRAQPHGNASSVCTAPELGT